MGERSCGNGEEFLPFRGRYLEKDEGSSVRAWACPRPGHPSTTFPLLNDPTYPRARGQAHAVRRIPTFAGLHKHTTLCTGYRRDEKKKPQYVSCRRI